MPPDAPGTNATLSGAPVAATQVEVLVVPPAARPARLDSIDLLRGIAMLFMVLDHVRGFFSSARFDPLDLTQTNVSLFLTRWITHPFAPAFVFLAGTSAYLFLYRGRTKMALAKFLVTRGLWLVLLELTIVRFAWEFTADYSVINAQILWVIGWSMVLLAGLIFLPRWALAAVSLGMIFLHNAGDSLDPASFGGFAWLWTVLHVQAHIPLGPGVVLNVFYPLVPWIGIMGIGYLFGALVLEEAGARHKAMYAIGIGCIAGFVLLRALNIYGDPHPWSAQDSPVKTILSFVNAEKYPPSLLFLLMTLGPVIALLPILERWRGSIARAITVFGRVPLFFYVLHLYVIHIIHAAAMVTARLTGGNPGFLFLNSSPEGLPARYGFSLAVVYILWLALLPLLYIPCAWFAGVKRRSANPFLSYL